MPRLQIVTAPIVNISGKQSTRWFVLAFVAFGLIQLAAIFLTPLSLAPDEAYYWDWSRRLDWGYYSKGPVVAWMIAASTGIFGDLAWAVRLPAFLCSSLTGILLFVWLRRLAIPGIALFIWLLMRASVGVSYAFVGMTTDPPLCLFWMIALWCGTLAIQSDNRRWWIGALIALGFAVLTKFTAIILLPFLICYLFFSPQYRRHLFSTEFCLGLVGFCLVLVPLLLWNIRNDWVTLLHNSSHFQSRPWGFKSLSHLPEFLAGQLGMIGPLLFLLIPTLLLSSSDELGKFLKWCSAPLLVVALALSCKRSVYPNWPLPAYLGLAGLGAIWLSRAGETGVRGFASRLLSGRIFVLLIVLNCVLFVWPHLFLFSGSRMSVPSKLLPSKKLVGWELLGENVDRVIKAGKYFEEATPVVLTDSYPIGAEIAFYSKHRPQVAVANIDNRRMNQYDLWADWESLQGRELLVVVDDEQKAENLRSIFTSLTRIREPLPIYYDGELMRNYYIYRGEGFSGRWKRPEAY